MLPRRTEMAISKRLSSKGITQDQVKQNLYRRIATSKHSHDTNFFSNICNNSAYWAGFIAADGNLSHYNKSRTPGLIINLKGSEGHILERFIKDCKFTGKVCYKSVYSKQTCKYYDISSVWIYGTHKWMQDLQEIYNITPKKSLTLQPPNIENHEQIKSFITGYIDGDGGIRQNNKGRGVYLQVLGTLPMLNWMLDQFTLYGLTGKTNIGVAGTSKVYSFVIHGKRTLPVLNSLLSVDVPRLDRKWDVAKDYIMSSK
jgi:hypothetical protein